MPAFCYEPPRDLAELRRDLFDDEVWIEGAYGRRRLLYADVTATGRHLRSLEAFIAGLRPFYANTHTQVSTTGRVMTQLREHARDLVRQAVGATTEDVVLFVGSGATAAVNKLVGLLGLKAAETGRPWSSSPTPVPPSRRPVVFIGPYEHHSNELPWVESIVEVVEIGLDARGLLDLAELESTLLEYRDRPFKLGAFSAASNVTGLLTDVPAVARILHRHGAYACFDYAAAAPYVPIAMHPPAEDERLDALFFSGHKLVGGPESSGVLVVRRDLCVCTSPERPGGGTVDFVGPRRAGHGTTRPPIDYLLRLEDREEGGTPAILADIRVGAALQVREAMDPAAIRDHEIAMAKRLVTGLAEIPGVRVLGPPTEPRLCVVSFVVDGLHHDFVSLLLDQLFGIQNRAGCSCAGPYGHVLLGLDETRSEAVRSAIAAGYGALRPGWVRISLPYYAAETDLSFVLRAVAFVARTGRDFLARYRLGWRTGRWTPLDEEGLPLRASLEARVGTSAPPTHANLIADRDLFFAEAEEAWRSVREAHGDAPSRRVPQTGVPLVDALTWFDYVHDDLNG